MFHSQRLAVASLMLTLALGAVGCAGTPASRVSSAQAEGSSDDVATAERKHAASVIARWQAMQQSNAHAGHVHINGICPYGIQDPRRPTPGLR
jgi:hypothetical protein